MAFCCQTIPQHCRSLCECISQLRKEFGTRVPLRSTVASISQLRNHCEMEKRDFAPKVPFRRAFRNCESGFGTRVPLRSTVTSISQLRNSLRSCCENGKLLRNWRFSTILAAPSSSSPSHAVRSPVVFSVSSAGQRSIAQNGTNARGKVFIPSNRKRSLRKEPSPGSVPEPAPKPSPSRPNLSSEAGATKAAGKRYLTGQAVSH
ncbi:hypothetical protein CK203_116914 [Vitis vinifera]|uniref:Uncharacterized protein n=1 Tax=Vitis vinifera TaxID=29760 RepID=A0A438CT39_VITVI|nr:hypothetical protein CK203_116914 [Vitis vinifera]